MVMNDSKVPLCRPCPPASVPIWCAGAENGSYEPISPDAVQRMNVRLARRDPSAKTARAFLALFLYRRPFGFPNLFLNAKRMK